jgi:hypothetical protein
MAVNETELKGWVKRTLGFPTQRVELTEDQLDDSIADAKRWFANWKGTNKEMTLAVIAGQSEYTLPNDVNDVLSIAPGVSAVDLRVLFTSFNFLDESIPYDLFRVPQAGGVYSTFAQTISYVDMVKRVMSSDVDYEFDRDSHKLRIFPVQKGSYSALISYKSATVDISSLDPRDEELIRRYTFARAKMRLGYLRSKFDSYPLAGGDKKLDGETLKQEAKEELEALQEEIVGLGFPMGIITG